MRFGEGSFICKHLDEKQTGMVGTSCGTCEASVNRGDRAVACETCGLWYHAVCQSIKSPSYSKLMFDDSDIAWHLWICGNHNYSSVLFDLHEIKINTTTSSRFRDKRYFVNYFYSFYGPFI